MSEDTRRLRAGFRICGLAWIIPYCQHITSTMSSSLPSTPISITVSATEKSNGRLTQCSLEIATRALLRDGLIVLEDVIDHTVLDRLNEKMVKDAYELQCRKDSPYGSP